MIMTNTNKITDTLLTHTELRTYPIDDIENITKGFFTWKVRSSLEPELFETKCKIIIFRDSLGYYWTFNSSSDLWYVYINDEWITMSRPEDQYLEGVDEALNYLAYTDVDLDAYYDSIKKIREFTPPEKPNADAYKEMICNIYQDYVDGYLTSLSSSILLKEHMIIDQDFDLWNVGCRSGKWYQFINDLWSVSERTPTISLSLPEDKIQEQKRAISLINFFKSGVGFLPELVSESWLPPSVLPQEIIQDKI